MKPSLDIRQANDGDASSIIELAQKTFVETYGETNKKENVELYMATMFSMDKICAEIRGDAERFYIAFNNGTPVGFTKMRSDRHARGLDGKRAIEIERIYVLKDFQGLKVGKELLDKCKSVASEEDYKIIWLQVWQRNSKAVQFYQKGGFVIYETATFQFGDEVHQDYVMRYDFY
jgi:hypothetical protein